VAIALGTIAALAALAPAATAAPPPSIRLLGPLTNPITTYSFRGRVPLDFGVLVSAIGGDVELRVSRPDYESPLVAWQADPGSGALLQTLPTENLKDWEGLRRFFRYTVTTRTGAPVATLYRPLCPNASERTRVSGEGPLSPRYTFACRSFSPFTKGMVWGIEEGWAVPAFAPDAYYTNFHWASMVLAPGSYRVKVEVMPFFRTFFSIAPEDAEVTVNLVVRKTRIGVIPPPGELRGNGRRASATASSVDLPIDPDPDPSTVPDLAALPAWAISTNHQGTKDFLSFASTGWNAGPAPMVVEGFRSGPGETMDAFQYFYDEDGKAVSRTPVGTFQFDHRGGHHHWHFLQFVRYSIIDAATDEIVRSFKQSFCLAPTDSIDLTVPGALYLPYLPEMSSVCGGEEARWLREALPAGWGDTYYQSVAGQAFNITTLPNGSYRIRVTMNPLGLLKEASAANNVEDRDILLFGRTGHRQVIAQPWHGISD
jgi:hypothetical protein